MEGLRNPRWERVPSPFGAPSSDLLLGDLHGHPVAFLPRHGAGHRIIPSAINSRANIDALKRVGVTDLLAISAVGSLREDLAPGALVLVDQFVDRTTQRAQSFFDSGMVAHVSMAHPVCRRLGNAVGTAAEQAGGRVHRGGTCVVIEGPQFSTRAESELYRTWGCHLVGMTAMPEARLAREAELCYAMLALVTDYDCWHPDHDAVTVDQVVATMQQNVGQTRALIERLPAILGAHTDCPERCDRALDAALMTAPEARDPAVLAKLDAVAARVLGKTRGR